MANLDVEFDIFRGEGKFGMFAVSKDGIFWKRKKDQKWVKWSWKKLDGIMYADEK